VNETMNEGQTADLQQSDDSEDTTQIEADIAATRDHMTGTIEEIGDRLDPATIVQEARDSVRDATVGKVEDMTSTATQALSGAGMTVQDTGTGLIETIKQHPIPAVLTGLGVAWLWTHRADTSMSSDARRYRMADEAYWRSDRGWSDGDKGSDGIGQQASNVADDVGRRMSDLGDTIGQVPSRVGGDDLVRQAQRFVDESPLAVGAVALAVGAAVGLAMPTTQTERRTFGPAVGEVVGQVGDRAKETLQKAQISASSQD
jgi:ElaB/YqjD/DUF883 family membrane-anchored ribosome-binding protein